MSIVYRHRFFVRLSHLITAICLPFLIMSGFQIFNAHPNLYFGERSDRDKPILSMHSEMNEEGELSGMTTIFGYSFDTTGVFGASKNEEGVLESSGFPSWSRLGGWLAMGRRWHFFFAWIFVINGLLFALYSLLSRHLSRDLIPKWTELRAMGQSILDHLRFRHAFTSRYNVLQKITYTTVIFVLGPLIVLTGLAMPPGMDAALPGLVDVFGGRQSARTLHFAVTFAFIAFTILHVFMVVVSGFWNNMKSMVTGWYRATESGEKHHDS